MKCLEVFSYLILVLLLGMGGAHSLGTVYRPYIYLIQIIKKKKKYTEKSAAFLGTTHPLLEIYTKIDSVQGDRVSCSVCHCYTDGWTPL